MVITESPAGGEPAGNLSASPSHSPEAARPEIICPVPPPFPVPNPLTGGIAIKRALCVRESCAWWIAEAQRCCVAQSAYDLRDIRDYVGINLRRIADSGDGTAGALLGALGARPPEGWPS